MMRPIVLSLAATLALTSAGFAAEAPKTLAKADPPKPAVALPAADADVMMSGKGEFTAEQIAFFESKVRPILSETCYKCHSVEKDKAKGGLTLDTREGWLKGGENGAVIKPGDPEQSTLIKAINYLDPDLQMPPKGEKLSAQQIADLTQWVKMGAPDPRKGSAKGGKLTGLTEKARHHWAYQPVKKPVIPTVKNRAWCRTPVDAFIMAKLEEKNMFPVPDLLGNDQDKSKLLRRATYDLLGLPPTPQEITAFLADNSPDAFARVVERLLASPHYGERWGRFWLDTARYADTIGGDRNANNNRRQDYRYPFAWTYRDWVINALNKDMPYDKFILAQLAADKMPESQKNPALLAGLGFLTVGERFRNPNDIINDRIDVVTKGFLGLTVACARCHDHMFDPIPTKDYYALHGVFASITEPDEKPLLGSSSPALLEDFNKKLAALEKENRDQYYQVLGETTAIFRQQAGNYLLAGQKGRDRASESELLKREALVKEHKLDEDMVAYIQRYTRRYDSVFIPWRLFGALSEGDYPTRGEALCKEIAEGKGGTINPLLAAAFRGQKPKSIDDVVGIYNALFKSTDGRAKDLYKAAAESKDGKYAGFDEATVELLAAPFHIEPATKLDTDGIREASQGWSQRMAGRAKYVFGGINALYLTHPGAPKRAMVVADKERPQNSPVFIRGQAESRGEIVPRRFLEVLSPGGKPQPFTQGSGRMDLAQAIASKDNPLTARVMVNRVWLHHFGEGFVRTPDDLGTQSEAPTHPELVDYLSWYFMEQGWSIKNLHRMVMNSHVYQITSASLVRKEYEQIDPENRLLWRANVRRLDFEAMRDSLLVYAGNLDPTVGGQPVNLTDEPYSQRRSVYGYIDRGNLPELMTNFDFSDPDMPNSKRPTTIVPQQALFLMNSSMSVDIARKIVARPEVTGRSDPRGRVIAIYTIIFQRPPLPAEIPVALSFIAAEERADGRLTVKDHKAIDSANKENQQQLAKKLADKGNGRDMYKAIQNEGATVERKPLTPLETYAQALLLSNEAAYVN